MRDATIAARGIGGSQIAALCGLDPRRDAFAVYAEVLRLVEPEEPTPRMRMGKRLEKVIAEAYGEETGQCIVWHDHTAQHETRRWQVYTVDAFVYPAESIANTNIGPVGILDSKNVALDQFPLWGEPGTDQVPDHIGLQAQWYCSGTGLPWCDIAALFGGNDLRIFRVTHDPEIEATLLEVAERFWHDNVLAEVPPPIGHSDTAARYLKQKFPRNVEHVREATPDEVMLLSRLKQEREVLAEAKARTAAVSNEVRETIGAADGIKDPVLGKVTWKRTKDTRGTDWRAVAAHLWADLNLTAQTAQTVMAVEPLNDYAELHEVILREGSRRLVVPRTWKSETEGEE
jgi:predicted phage-related endonuclease